MLIILMIFLIDSNLILVIKILRIDYSIWLHLNLHLICILLTLLIMTLLILSLKIIIIYWHLIILIYVLNIRKLSLMVIKVLLNSLLI
jgi:hypothetical protein